MASEACREQRPDLKIRLCDSPEEMAEDCDALVVVTEWQQFRTLDLARLGSVMHTRILVDGRNLFLPEEALAAGFDYTGIGRCARPRAAADATVPAGATAGETAR